MAGIQRPEKSIYNLPWIGGTYGRCLQDADFDRVPTIERSKRGPPFAAALVSAAYTTSMSGGYRESAAVTRVPVAEIAWRRRVAKGAMTLAMSLMVFGAGAVPESLQDLRAWRTLVLLLAVPAAWLMTTPRHGRRGWLAWLLVLGVAAGGVLSFLALQGVISRVPAAVASSVALVEGLEFLARLHLEFGHRRAAHIARVALVPAAGLVVVSLFKLPSILEYVLWGAGLSSALLALVLALWFAGLAPDEQQTWWLDNSAATPGVWVSLLAGKTGHATVLSADGELGSFASENEAYDWLEQHGYVWSENALEEGLVAELPPELVAETRARARRLR